MAANPSPVWRGETPPAALIYQEASTSAMSAADARFRAAERLHRYLRDDHGRGGGALVGPDPGVRFNYRVGRFLKGALPALRWNDACCYLQGQGYWMLANWQLWASTGDQSYRGIAVRTADTVLSAQRPDGAWDYPNREWQGRVANAEGTWAAIGLLQTYRCTRDERYLDGVRRWHGFLVRHIGYQRCGDTLAANYFAHRAGQRVLNNSAFVLRFLADLARVVGDEGVARPCAGLVAFLAAAQGASGELPYTVAGAAGGSRPHFQCFQYNAFQCLDLMRYSDVTGDPAARPVIEGVLRFLATGLAADGHAGYECGNFHRAVTYHTAVLAAAFTRATRLGLAACEALAHRAYAHLLGLQRPDGGFPYSRGEYRVLQDWRSYPRYLAMILCHLLQGSATWNPDPVERPCASASSPR